jgi:hypothetical protein
VADMALKVRRASDLIKQAKVLNTGTIGEPGPPPAAQPYPGAPLDTRYVARLARYCVADVLRCDPLELIGKERGPRKLAFANKLAIHLAHIVAGRRHEEVAIAFGRNRSTASHHFEALENLRDVEQFDQFLTMLEQRFTHMLRYAETTPVRAWAAALEAMERRVSKGELEADTHFDAKFVVETFRVRDKRRRSR